MRYTLAFCALVSVAQALLIPPSALGLEYPIELVPDAEGKWVQGPGGVGGDLVGYESGQKVDIGLSDKHVPQFDKITQGGKLNSEKRVPTHGGGGGLSINSKINSLGDLFKSFSQDLLKPGPSDDKESQILLGSALVVNRGVSIFASLLRNQDQVQSRFDNPDLYTIIFAPDNEAMMALPQKPWSFPKPVSSLGSKEDEAVARENELNFLQNHIVYDIGIVQPSYSSAAGYSLSVEKKDDGKEYVVSTRPGIEPAQILKVTILQNGVVFTINGVLSTP